MPNALLLETDTDHFLLEDDSGVLLMEPAAILIVADKTALTTTDAAVRDRLIGLSYTPTIASDEDAALTTASYGFVMVAESTIGATFGTKYKTATIPVLYLDNTPSLNGDLVGDNPAGVAGQTAVDVTNASHSAAGGLSGTVTVFSSGQALTYATTSSLPAAAATYLSFVADATKTVAATVETGQTLLGAHGLAESRRAFLYLFFEGYGATQTANAWTLFDALITWAVASPRTNRSGFAVLQAMNRAATR